MGTEIAAWFMLVPGVCWLIYNFMIYPLIYRTKHPVPRTQLLSPTPDLRLDPEPFKRKRLERRNERVRWANEYRALVRKLEPKVWDDPDLNDDLTTIRDFTGQIIRQSRANKTRAITHKNGTVHKATETCYKCERNNP